MDFNLNLSEAAKKDVQRLNKIYEYSIFGSPVGSTDKSKTNRELLLGEDEDIENVEVEDNNTDVEQIDDTQIQPQEDNLEAPIDNQPQDVQPTQPIPQEPEGQVDVTELVTKQQDILSKLILTSDSINQLLANNELFKTQIEAIHGKVDQLDNEIDSVKHEVVERNPTPVEQLQLRSLEMYPNYLDITQFWKEKEAEGGYKVSPDDPNKVATETDFNMEVETEPENKELVITQDDIDNTNDFDVKKSLGLRR